MNRRNFLKTSGAGLLATSSLMSIPMLGCGEAPATTKTTAKSGKLILRFKPYELKLKHSFNLAKSSRTTTPDVQVELEYDGIYSQQQETTATLYLPYSFITLSHSAHNLLQE